MLRSQVRFNGEIRDTCTRELNYVAIIPTCSNCTIWPNNTGTKFVGTSFKLRKKIRKFRFVQTFPRGGGEGGTPLYKLYRYVPPQRVWFLSRFGLKTGIEFDHYGLKSGMVFKGTTGAYKRICLFNSK